MEDKNSIVSDEKRTVNPNIVNNIVAAVRGTKNIYIKGKNVIANNLAGDIVFDKFNPTDFTGINRGFMVLDSKDIYIYYDGYYHPEGKEVIETVSRIIMGDKARNQNVVEVVTAVKQMLSISIKIKDIQEHYKHLISLKNGILNVKTGELLQHSKDYPLIEQMNLIHNKDAKCPIFLKYINDVLAPDDVLVIQEMFGYILYKTYKYPNFFLFIGSGRNGKTTLLNLVKNFIGSDSLMSLSLHELTSSQFSMATLFGKLANISGDIGATSISDTSVLKILTGNDDITARRFHQDFIRFTNHAKLIFAANNAPEFPDDKTVAFSTRLTFLEFNNYFPLGDPKTDVDILDKMTTEEELSGILNWAIEGLHRLLKNNKLSYNKSTENNLRLYEEKSNPILGFLSEVLEVEIGKWLDKSEVLFEYNKWCVKNQKPVLSEVGFNKKLFQTLFGVQSYRIKTPEGDRIWVYKNIRWKDHNHKSGNFDNIEYPAYKPQQKLDDLDKTIDEEYVGITLGDKIESLKTCLENNPLTFDELIREGFNKEFLEKCEEQNIIIKRSDGKFECA